MDNKKNTLQCEVFVAQQFAEEDTTQDLLVEGGKGVCLRNSRLDFVGKAAHGSISEGMMISELSNCDKARCRITIRIVHHFDGLIPDTTQPNDHWIVYVAMGMSVSVRKGLRFSLV